MTEEKKICSCYKEGLPCSIDTQHLKKIMAYVGKTQHFYEVRDAEWSLPNTLSHKNI